VTSMGSAKKQASQSVSLLRLFSWMAGPGRAATAVVALVGAFAAGGWWAWQKHRPQIRAQREHVLGPEQVEIVSLTPSPWMHRDIRAEVFRNPTLDGPVSLLDDDLVERVRRAFQLHPWVAKVESVVKQYGKVKVTLAYRKPVCMVGASGPPLPVDATGVLLPNGDGDFSSIERGRYPCLVGVEGGLPGPAGTPWGDARVVGGAEIAATLAEVWEPMRLHTIVPSAVAGSREPSFALETHSGTQILWGSAPGAAPAPGEPTAAEKLVWLKRYFFDHDTLDGPPALPQEIDLRHWPPSVRPKP
jgi:hypothetical protein